MIGQEPDNNVPVPVSNSEDVSPCERVVYSCLAAALGLSLLQARSDLYPCFVGTSVVMLVARTRSVRAVFTILSLILGFIHYYSGSASPTEHLLIECIMVARMGKVLLLGGLLAIVLLVMSLGLLFALVLKGYEHFRKKQIMRRLTTRTKHSQLEDEPTPCAICLDEFALEDQICTLPCSHEFHSKCVQEWLIKTWNCPVCRSALTAQL
jgi:hypothetical protein